MTYFMHHSEHHPLLEFQLGCALHLHLATWSVGGVAAVCTCASDDVARHVTFMTASACVGTWYHVVNNYRPLPESPIVAVYGGISFSDAGQAAAHHL
jgi:hypothetical protein